MSRLDLSDQGAVSATAASLAISEIEIFQCAYQRWFGRPGDEVEIRAEFDRFIRRSVVPMWVRDYIRWVDRQAHAGVLNPTTTTAVEPCSVGNGTRKSDPCSVGNGTRKSDPCSVGNGTRKSNPYSSEIDRYSVGNGTRPTGKRYRMMLIGFLAMAAIAGLLWLLLQLAIQASAELQLQCLLPPCY